MLACAEISPQYRERQKGHRNETRLQAVVGASLLQHNWIGVEKPPTASILHRRIPNVSALIYCSDRGKQKDRMVIKRMPQSVILIERK